MLGRCQCLALGLCSLQNCEPNKWPIIQSQVFYYSKAKQINSNADGFLIQGTSDACIKRHGLRGLWMTEGQGRHGKNKFYHLYFHDTAIYSQGLWVIQSLKRREAAKIHLTGLFHFCHAAGFFVITKPTKITHSSALTEKNPPISLFFLFSTLSFFIVIKSLLCFSLWGCQWCLENKNRCEPLKEKPFK